MINAWKDIPPGSNPPELVTAVIEIPRGSRNKYEFDEKLGVFALGGVLPSGAVFPYDFGYVPRTRAEDGDPLDVLVLMDEPAFVGCVVPVRPHLVELLDVLLVGVALGDAQDLEVLALVVAHLEDADGPGPDVAAGERRLVDDEEGVGVIAVVRAGPLDEAVVEVVEDGRGEDAVEAIDARGLVELVLVPAAARDLDDDLDTLGEAAVTRYRDVPR